MGTSGCPCVLFFPSMECDKSRVEVRIVCISHLHLLVCYLSGLVRGVDFLTCQELPLGY